MIGDIYNDIPKDEIQVSISWEVSEIVDGRVQITEHPEIQVNAKVFISRFAQRMTSKTSEVERSDDEYVVIIPKSESYTLPISRDVKYTIRTPTETLQSLRIHDHFGHYSIDCVVSV